MSTDGGETSPSSPSSPSEAQPKGVGISVPRSNDVLCGRGGATNNHPGNLIYRKVVNHNKKWYVLCLKHHKILLSKSIVLAIGKQNPAGRFLARDSNDGLWYDIGYKKAVEKTSQALREGAGDVRKRHSMLLSKSGNRTESVEREEQQGHESDSSEERHVPGIDPHPFSKRKKKKLNSTAVAWDEVPPTELDGVIAYKLASLVRKGPPKRQSTYFPKGTGANEKALGANDKALVGAGANNKALVVPLVPCIPKEVLPDGNKEVDSS